MLDIKFMDGIKYKENMKSLLYTQGGNTPTVDRLIQRSISKQPNSFHAWYAWGVIQKLQDNLVSAEKKLKKAIELEPHNLSAWYELARVYTFREKFKEAEEIFLRIIELDLDFSVIQNTDIMLHIADNYLYWSDFEFKKKRIKSWKKYINKAFEFILLAIDINPQNRKVHELHKQICYNYAIKFCELKKKQKCEEYFLKTVANITCEGNAILCSKDTLLDAYINLLRLESSKNSPKLSTLDHYLRQISSIAPKKEFNQEIQKIQRFVQKEKKRKVGRIVSYNKNRKYGIIHSNKRSYIFFPKCLTWFSKDLPSLVKREVSFIPVSHTSINRPKNQMATEIKLIQHPTK